MPTTPSYFILVPGASLAFTPPEGKVVVFHDGQKLVTKDATGRSTAWKAIQISTTDDVINMTDPQILPTTNIDFNNDELGECFEVGDDYVNIVATGVYALSYGIRMEYALWTDSSWIRCACYGLFVFNGSVVEATRQMGYARAADASRDALRYTGSSLARYFIRVDTVPFKVQLASAFLREDGTTTSDPDNSKIVKTLAGSFFNIEFLSL